MPWVGCYDLVLYCDKDPCKVSQEIGARWGDRQLNENGNYITVQEFVTYDRKQAFREARKAGWILHRDEESLATCPFCNNKHKGGE